MFATGIILFLAAIFLVMGVWQRLLDRDEKKKVFADIEDAHARGSNKPIGQYPIINPYLCIGCGSCIAACPEDEVIGLVNGVAQVIHASRCVGHALCEEVCPVNAIKVGLGDVTSRPDIPILSADDETSIPGIFIAGELRGLGLIRNAMATGTKAVETIAERIKRRSQPPAPGVYDVAIIGAGPAGIAASLKAIELKLNYFTISQEEVGGAVKKYPRRKLTLVQAMEIPLYGRLKGGEYEKEKIIEIWDQILKQNQVKIHTGWSLKDIRKQGGDFEVLTSEGNIRARFVLLAIGRRGTPRRLGIAGEEAEKVLYQLIDTTGYNRQRLLVVGGGDSAVEAATGLANQTGNTVTLSYRKENFFRLKSRNEKRIRDYMAQDRVRVYFSSQVESIGSKDIRLAVEEQGQKKSLLIPNDYVFIFAGGDPPYPLLQKIGIRFGGEGAPAIFAKR